MLWCSRGVCTSRCVWSPSPVKPCNCTKQPPELWRGGVSLLVAAFKTFCSLLTGPDPTSVQVYGSRAMAAVAAGPRE